MKQKMNSIGFKSAALVLSLFLFSGCAFKTSAPVTEYTLTANNIVPVTSSRYRNKTLKVDYPQPLKEKLSQSIQYSYSLSDRGEYLNSQWANGLSQLIQGTLIDALERSKNFKGVVSYASTAYADYRLESTVYDFSHHIRGKESYAIVSLKFTLIDTSTGKLVKTKKFSYKEYTTTVDARGFVEASNRAMSKLSRDLANWLR